MIDINENPKFKELQESMRSRLSEIDVRISGELKELAEKVGRPSPALQEVIDAMNKATAERWQVVRDGMNDLARQANEREIARMKRGES